MTYVVDRTHYGTGTVLGTTTEDIDVRAYVGVCSTDGVAIAMLMDAADLNVDGEVLGYGTGAWIAGDHAAVTVGAMGTIGANGPQYARGLDVQGGGLLVENDGFIMGYDTAVRLMGGNGTTSTLVNRGNVTGNLVALFRDLGDSDSVADTVVVSNHGLIHGTEAAIAVHEQLDAHEVVTNRGHIHGDVSLGLGSDLYDGRDGTIEGRVLLGAGSDTARPGSAKEAIYGDTGSDTLDFDGSAAVVVSLADASRNTGAALGDSYFDFEDIIGTAWSDDLAGNSASNALFGGADNDTLDGGAGNDRLEGGLGNDTFVVDVASDVVVEAAAGGTDQVKSAVSWALGAELENLVLLGTGAINGTGNALANRLTGNAGNNHLSGREGHDTLDGGAGTDRLEGGAGNDTFVLATSGDTVVELAGGGTDLVRAAYGLTLGANVENLELTGTASVFGAGNTLSNQLTGNAGNNQLSGAAGIDALLGGAGNDTLNGGAAKDALTGGLGNDAFVFASLAEAGDTIADFHNVSGDNDLFRISAAGFGSGLVAGRTLAASQFQIRADNLAQDADDRFIFRSTDKTLWFDSNGKTAGGLTLVADLQADASVTYADILLV